jgi:hypothetical protein
LIPTRRGRRDPGLGALTQAAAPVLERFGVASDTFTTPAALAEPVAIDEGARTERFAQAIARLLWTAIQSGTTRGCL